MANGNSNSVIKCAMTCMVVLLSAGSMTLYWQAKTIRRLNDQVGEFLSGQGVRIVDSLDRISDRLDRPSGNCPWCGQRFMWSESAKDYLKVYDLTSHGVQRSLERVNTSLTRLQEFIKENKETK